MFWLSYFLRKNLQEENLDKVQSLNKGTLEKWQSDQIFKQFYVHQAA